jgi:phosphonate transport system substrate-binding protein
MSDLRILWTSDLIPDGPYVVRKALPQEVKDLYRQVLLDLADRDRACFEGIVGGDAIDFEPITEDYYDSMIAILRDS